MRIALGAIAGAVTLAASVANAADVPQALPQPICVPRAQANVWPGVPICVEEFGGWYLRGDIGITNQRVKKLENVLLPDNTKHVNSDFDSSGLFGIGAGYQFNNWLRVDVTGEYRGNSDFHGLDIVPTGTGRMTDEYTAKKSEWLVLANAYLDLGTWWCITPFVGAGIGAARVSFSDFVDVNTPRGGVAFAPDESKWNLAWALHAGLAFQATNNLAIELAYRYTHLGDGHVGDAVDFRGNNIFNNPTTFKDITSHDLKLGLRWTCCDAGPPPPPPPIMRKG